MVDAGALVGIMGLGLGATGAKVHGFRGLGVKGHGFRVDRA